MKKNKILVIRFRRVGDAVLSTSVCTTIKKTNPDTEIHYVVDESIGSLFLNHPDIDRVITFSSKEKHSYILYLKKVWHLMRKEKYDAIIDFRSTGNTLPFSLFSPNTKFRIGVKKNYNRFIHNKRIIRNFSTDYIDQMNQFLEPLSKELSIEKNRKFYLYVTEQEKADFIAKMKLAKIDFNKPIICCAVATRLVYKRWPMATMKTVLEFLIKEYDAQLIFNFSGEEETNYAHELYKKMDNDPHIFIDIEANNIRELACMISDCDFFFGNEGGPRHIAQALQIPSFAIFPHSASLFQWLPDMSDRNVGIEPADIDRDIVNDPNKTYEEIFGLITAEEVIKRLKQQLTTLQLLKFSHD